MVVVVEVLVMVGILVVVMIVAAVVVVLSNRKSWSSGGVVESALVVDSCHSHSKACFVHALGWLLQKLCLLVMQCSQRSSFWTGWSRSCRGPSGSGQSLWGWSCCRPSSGLFGGEGVERGGGGGERVGRLCGSGWSRSCGIWVVSLVLELLQTIIGWAGGGGGGGWMVLEGGVVVCRWLERIMLWTIRIRAVSLGLELLQAIMCACGGGGGRRGVEMEIGGREGVGVEI